MPGQARPDAPGALLLLRFEDVKPVPLPREVGSWFYAIHPWEHESVLLCQALAGLPCREPEIELKEFRLESATPRVKGWLGTPTTATLLWMIQAHPSLRLAFRPLLL